ncbi:PKD domain-containing protein [Dokdonella soli]|uniref:PKD domain-containing protein n=1 Tax=Dokdonella soli TaxID=529810 RepID=A0ABN1IFD2_9GAMM
MLRSTNISRRAALTAAIAISCWAIGPAQAIVPPSGVQIGADSPVAIGSATNLGQGDVVNGLLPFTQPIHIQVALKLRNNTQLMSFLRAAAQPSVMGVHAVMSPDEFVANHSPTVDQANAVVAFLTQAGFKNVVVAPNRLLVSADGTADVAQAAFQTSFARVRTKDGRDAFANTADVHIPTVLQSSVLAVIGLQTVHQAHTMNQVVPQSGAGIFAVTGHNPTEFSSIYSGTGVATAAGVTVGIITQGAIGQTITDLNTFTSNNGLPTVTTQTVNTNGTSTDASGVGEWNLDSQDIVGMGGGQVGKIIFYNIPTLSNADLTADINTVVTANAAKIINVSLGECETSAQGDGSAAAQDQSFQQAVAQGQTFSISTGDSGADECANGGITPSWPAASQYVVAVAGTKLDASTTTWNSEVVWNDLPSNGATGGSPSTFEPKPSWQNALVSGTTRGVADVAFDASPFSGAKVIVNGASQQIGGTSLSAPIFAGMWARVIAVKGTSVGFAAPLLYQLPASDFHDIVSGNNGGFSAGPGYDFASGRGSVILSSAINHIGGVVGGTPTANFSFTTSGLTATFTDSSTDSGGTISSHAWTFGDGGTSTATSPSHTYAAAGTYSVTETVKDSVSGATNAKTQSVTVASAGGTPTANFAFTTNGLTATFTDSSTDSGGTIGTHAWTFGDGGTSTATNPSHTYAAAGTYSVTETVTDSVNSTTSSKTASVTVSGGGGSTQLLVNPGFESSISPWTATSGVDCSTGCSGESAHAGAGFVWLNGYGSTHTDTVSQKVAITAGKSKATLQYYLHIDTAETTTTTAYDKLTVGVYNSSGTLLKTLATYSNLNAASGYTVHSNDVSAYIGQTVTIKFTGTEDASLQTSFVLDDVTLTVQ